MATNLRELFGTISLKAGEGLKQLKKFNDLLDESQDELDDTEDKTESLGKELGRLGGHALKGGKAVAKGIAVGTGALVAGTAAVFAFSKAWAEGADEIGKRASKLGVAADALQEMGFAAELSGAEAANLNDSLKDLQIATFDALKGSGPLKEALDALGISAETVAEMDVIDRFSFLADEINKVGDESTRTALIVKAFGASGLELGDLIKQGSEGIAAGRAELREWGLVLDKEALANAAKFNDTLSRQGAIFRAFTSFLASKTVPVLTKYLTKFNKLIVSNRELIQQRAEQAFALVARFLEEGIPLLGETIDLTSKLIENIGGIDSAIRAGVEAWALFRLAALATTGPIGAVVALVGGLAIGIARLRREAQKEREAADARDKKLRNPDDPTAGLSVNDLARQEGLDLLDAAQEQKRATDRLRKLQTEAQVRDELNKRGDALAQVPTGKSGLSANPELFRQRAQAREDARKQKRELEQAQKDAEKAQQNAAKKREDFDKALEKERSKQSEKENEETQKSLKDIMKALDAGRSGGGGGGKKKDEKKPATLQEQLEAAFRGEAIPTNGPIQPSSLGATINNVDNRIIVNVGGITQEVQTTGAESAREIATQSAELAMGPVRDQIETAYAKQRSVFAR